MTGFGGIFSLLGISFSADFGTGSCFGVCGDICSVSKSFADSSLAFMLFPPPHKGKNEGNENGMDKTRTWRIDKCYS